MRLKENMNTIKCIMKHQHIREKSQEKTGKKEKFISTGQTIDGWCGET